MNELSLEVRLAKMGDRTWCGRYRCCREAEHNGACEEDITMLEEHELQAIEASAQSGSKGDAL